MTSLVADQQYNINREKAMKTLLWVTIVSMIMLFAGITSAYIVRQAEGRWLEFQMPAMFYISTGLILTSSISMSVAKNAAKKNEFGKVKAAVALTLILGLGFALTQFLGWGQLVDNKIFFAGTQSNASGSFFYVLTALHLAHLAGGIIALLVVLRKSLLNKYTETNNLGISLATTYWHFLDILWVYLFLFLLFIR